MNPQQHHMVWAYDGRSDTLSIGCAHCINQFDSIPNYETGLNRPGQGPTDAHQSRINHHLDCTGPQCPTDTTETVHP